VSVEIFLSTKGRDTYNGRSADKARKTFPSLTPDPKEDLCLWLSPGIKLTDLDLSGWKYVRIMPWVPSKIHGGGAKLIRDWEESLGEKPSCSNLTITGCGFTILHLNILNTLMTKDQIGKPAPSEEEPEERVFTILKGVKAKLWVADNWEYTQGTLDDVEIDEVKMASATTAVGIKEVVLTENTDHEGKPKGNVKLKIWRKSKGKKESGKRLTIDKMGRLNLSNKKNFEGWSGLSGMGK